MTTATRCEHCGTALRELNRNSGRELLCLSCYLAGAPQGDDTTDSDPFLSSVSTLRGGTNKEKVEEGLPGSTEPFAAPMSEKLAGVPPEPNWLWQGYLSPGP
jgi:hypothetical protein